MATTTQTVTISIPRGPVRAELNFYRAPEDGSAPSTRIEQGATFPNFGNDTHLVTISDVRGHEGDFTLEKNAFQMLQGIQSEMQARDFDDDEHVKRVYFPETEKLLLENVPGAKRVLIFDHTIRRSIPSAARSPAMNVHIDQTMRSAIERLRLHVPDDAEKLLRDRFRIINVWRPINGPVYANPLAFADCQTVDGEDVVPVKRIHPKRSGEFAGVKYNATQQWHYWSGITNEERLLLQCADSHEEVGSMACAPHSAFIDPRTPAEAPARESIEVRAFVFS